MSTLVGKYGVCKEHSRNNWIEGGWKSQHRDSGDLIEMIFMDKTNFNGNARDSLLLELDN